jgi:3'-phosphoadenosine 5'-phosphosulfate sulfotransferase (PAPS reductase)/FAD synthetase
MSNKRDAALLHARFRAFPAKVEQSHRIIKRALREQGDSWYVALSGGKDSAVVRALVSEQIPAITFNDGWELPETAAYLAGVPNLQIVKTRTHHTDWFVGNADDADAPAYGADWAVTQGYRGCFLGLRADENARRRLHLKRYGALFYAAGRGIWQCNPIAAWDVWDVWAYIYANEVSYNAAYDRLDVLGVPIEEQRIGPLASERVLGYGQLAILKRGWPELFNRFAAAHPEARAYV